jgi:Spy/CpxP family protein refolding chaperone
MKRILTAVVLASSLFVTAQAVYAGDHHKMKTEAERAEFMVEKMTKHLELTEAQQSQIKPVLLEKMSKMKAAKDESKAKIDAILTDEQKAKMAEHKDKKSKQCKDKKHHKGHDKKDM